MGWNPVQDCLFFQASISQLFKLTNLCITNNDQYGFISFSAVQIYDLSYIHLHSLVLSFTLFRGVKLSLLVTRSCIFQKHYHAQDLF